MSIYPDINTNGDTSLLTMIEQAELDYDRAVRHIMFFGSRGSTNPTNGELREDGSFELREDGTFELREQLTICLYG